MSRLITTLPRASTIIVRLRWSQGLSAYRRGARLAAAFVDVAALRAVRPVVVRGSLGGGLGALGGLAGRRGGGLGARPGGAAVPPGGGGGSLGRRSRCAWRPCGPTWRCPWRRTWRPWRSSWCRGTPCGGALRRAAGLARRGLGGLLGLGGGVDDRVGGLGGLGAHLGGGGTGRGAAAWGRRWASCGEGSWRSGRRAPPRRPGRRR